MPFLCSPAEVQYRTGTGTLRILIVWLYWLDFVSPFTHGAAADPGGSLSLGQMARAAHEAAPAGAAAEATALEAPALRLLRQSCARALLRREPLES